MTARSDQELLHAALDGALSDEEAADLRERLAEDAALRAEADRLKQLAGLVDALGPSDPPESFSDRVMEAVARSHPEPAAGRQRVRAWLDQLLGSVPGHLQQEKASGGVVRWHTGSAGGGDIVAKKALWAVAGLAVVIILGVVYFNGTRSVDQGAQGTIGGAERYRGTQPSSVAVTEGDVQKFLQSDVFDRMIKDEHVLSLLEKGDTRRALAEVDLASLLGKDVVRAGLTDPEVLNALRGDGFRGVMEDSDAAAELGRAGVLASLAEPEVLMALRQEGTRSLLQDAEVTVELQKEGVARALKEPALVVDVIRIAKGGTAKDQAKMAENVDLQVAMRRAKVRRLLADDTVGTALRAGPHFALLITQPELASVIGNVKVRALVQDKDWETAARGQKLAMMLNDTGFAAEIGKRAAKKKLMALFEPDVLYAIQNPEFYEGLHSNRSLIDAMNSDAMDAALVRLRRR